VLRARQGSQRGSVLVLVVVAIFPLIGLMTFVIDVSHWFDYSRNLQNRADAAALAAGSQYSNICFNGNAGDQWTGLQSTIGKWGQLYSGPGTQAAGGGDHTTAQGSAGGPSTANVPYTDASVFDKVANNGTGVGAYKNTPNLTKGPLSNYYVRINATNYYDKVATPTDELAPGASPPPNFGMGDFCTTTPARDSTDNSDQSGPMVDVKVTQYQLGNFIPIFGAVGPNIEAHARVQLQNEGSPSNVTPIAVRDSAFTPCVSVNFVNASTNGIIKTITLDRTSPQTSSPVTWDNIGSPASIDIPANANVYLQPYLNLCNGNGQTLNDTTNTGLLYINSAPADPTPTPGAPPKITSKGVTLTDTGSCAPDQYFAVVPSGTCGATLSAWVEFQPPALGHTPLNSGDVTVTAIDHESGGTTVNIPLTLQGSFTAGQPAQFTGPVTINPNDGIKQFEITWKQTNGSVSGTACGDGHGHNPNPCTGTFGIQQQAFSACDGCDAPDDSGPVVLMQVGQTNGVVTNFGANSLPAGQTANNVVVKLQLEGLSAAVPGDPPTVLRFGSGQQTGLVNCGQQGSGVPDDVDTIIYGCGPNNPKVPGLNPLYVNARNGDCSQPWPQGNHQDCVQTTPGNRRNPIPGAFVTRITANGCANAVNHWVANPTDGSPGYVVPSGDPRAITMIITSDVDLTLAHNGSQAWIPIWRFATFYVTGWDKNEHPVCGDNDPFPGTGKKKDQNATVWGHWITYTDNTGNGDNTGCNGAELGNCVPVLTR
jgi:Putative Flp pilus-assembly TadE/G-like